VVPDLLIPGCEQLRAESSEEVLGTGPDLLCPERTLFSRVLKEVGVHRGQNGPSFCQVVLPLHPS
jgi:hypothetical protein